MRHFDSVVLGVAWVRIMSTRDGWDTLLEPLAQLRAAWPQRGWSYDTRFSVVASSFHAELEPKARAAARLALPHEWNAATIANAPAELKKIVELTGGVRASQMVMGGGSVLTPNTVFLYGLWWPWGDGTTTSLRIGIGGGHIRESVLTRLRDAFGVTL